MKKYLPIIILFTILILLVVFIPNLNGNFIKNSKLYINEVLPSNKYTIKDDDSETSDYIEIYNGYNHDINLQDYYLSDSEYETKKWSFPSITIKSNEYLLIYASGKDKVDLDNNILHTNFKLSSTGEVITLTDSYGNIISKITYPEMLPDISYGYSQGEYFLMSPTPNIKNTSQEYQSNKEDLTNKIIINEYLTNNRRSSYDTSGGYYDWVELYNPTSNDITLENIYLTDNEQDLIKFKVPKVTIKSNDYLLIYLTNHQKNTEEGIYANFKLSQGETLVLSNGKNIFDKVITIELPEDISYGLKDNRWLYFPSPTPGTANTTAGLTKMGGNSHGNS